jgi:hypothetical protein
MSDSSELVARSDVVALAARVRELEALLVRTSIGEIAKEGGTNGCTHCGSNCSYCRGDRFVDVLLPGEMAPLTGSELVTRVQAIRAK